MKNTFRYSHFRKNKGQLVLETAFVFTLLIFLVFTIVNFGIIFHTKNIATYAAFMGARSYQVMGDLSRSKNFDAFETLTKNGKQKSFLMSAKTATPYQVAEDIFTCALPWVTVPEGDGETTLSAVDLMKTPSSRCMEGKRKYKNMNVGDTIRFEPFGDKDPSSFLSALGGGDKSELNSVLGAFSEPGRPTLQYGILSLQYKKPILFNPFGLFSAKNGESKVFVDEVFVPVLLNPGLNTKFKKDDGKTKKFEEDKISSNVADRSR